MKKFDLSIIIVSYNTKEFLKRCLESILSSIKGGLSYEIIVVDNASEDGTDSVVKELFLSRHSGKRPKGAHPESPTIQRDSGRTSFARMTKSENTIYIQNDKNLGFSKANNIGIKQAKGRYLLFLNPDTAIYPNVLKTMVDFMDKHRDTGAATCRVALPNGEIDDASHRGFPTPWNSFCYFLGFANLFPHSELLNGYHLGFRNLDRTHEIDACAGAFMIVRRKAGESIGWWDEDYFFYGEDLDFCYRLKHGLTISSSSESGEVGESRNPKNNRSGQARATNKLWKIYYVSMASILHYKGVSGGIKSSSKQITTASKETKIRATKARYGAMRIFYRKHYQDKYPKLITWLIYSAINLKEHTANLAQLLRTVVW